MTKSEFISEVAKKAEITQTDAKKAIDAFWSIVMDEVKKDGEVSFIGTGKFYKKHTEARKGRNPRTGEEIEIAASDKLAFKATLKL